MANNFVNAGDTNISTSGDVIYTCGSGKQCLVHALYLSNIDGTNAVDATVEVEIDINGESTYVTIAKTVPIPADSTLILDKPLNLEAGDKLKITSSATGDLSAFASILEIS